MVYDWDGNNLLNIDIIIDLYLLHFLNVLKVLGFLIDGNFLNFCSFEIFWNISKFFEIF